MPRKPAKKKPHAAEKEISVETLRNLRKIHCTEAEAAAVFGVSRRTIIRRLKIPEYRQAWDEGLQLCTIGLKRQGFRHAQMPNSAGVQAWIHLTKQILGWTEKHALELSGRVDTAVEVTSPHDRLALKLDRVAERIHTRIAEIAAAAGATRPGQDVAGGADGVHVAAGAPGGAGAA